jgi:hypothetical protein
MAAATKQYFSDATRPAKFWVYLEDRIRSNSFILAFSAQFDEKAI